METVIVKLIKKYPDTLECALREIHEQDLQMIKIMEEFLQQEVEARR